MKIYGDGSRFFGSQIQRIEQGFIELGQIIENIQEADLIYSNNAFYEDVINLKQKLKPKGKFIFNVLDCAAHIPTFPIQKLKEHLAYADAVTTISKYVQNDLKSKTGIDSTVIYQPQMGISKLENQEKKYKVLAIGRISDPNKRTKLAVDAFLMAGYKPQDFCYVGSEYLGIGKYFGIVHNGDELNEIYNSVEYVVASGLEEGIGLPSIECLAAGKIPIICNDLTTRQEFFPSDKFPEYDAVNPNSIDILKFITMIEGDNDVKLKFKDRLYQHYKENLEDKFKGISVAKKILEVYENIK